MASKVQGVILHPASLPGRFGTGDLGPEAWHWLDILGEAGVSTWVLPVDVEDLSLLSFDLLHHDGALLASDMAMLPVFDEVEVNTEAVHEVRWAFLHLAARRFVCQCEASPLLRRSLELFGDDESGWLDDVALFGALQDDEQGRFWQEWPKDLKLRQPEAMDAAMVSLESQIEERKALHYLLSRQWRRLRARAMEAGVRLAALKRPSAGGQSFEAWLGDGRSLSNERALVHMDDLLEPAEIQGPGWLRGEELLGKAGEPAGASWRFHWSDVTEAVLKRLV